MSPEWRWESERAAPAHGVPGTPLLPASVLGIARETGAGPGEDSKTGKLGEFCTAISSFQRFTMFWILRSLPFEKMMNFFSAFYNEKFPTYSKVK